MSHAILSPSSSVRWLTCLGSVPVTLGEVDESSEYADQGTAAHTLASLALTELKSCAEYEGRVIDVLNDDGSIRRQYVVASEDKPATDKPGSIDASYVQVYVDSINDRRHASALVMIEQRVESGVASMLYGPVNGTGDAIIIAPEFKLIEIHDLKYGKGEQVYAVENTQLRLYGLGTIALAKSLGFDIADWTIRMCIHQPRRDHFSDEPMAVRELEAWGAWAQSRVDAIDAGDTTMTPSEKGCRWCPHAKAPCAALSNFTMQTVTEEFPPVTDMTEWGLGKALDRIELVEEWVKAVRSAARAALDAGQPVPGWKLVQGRSGNREWKKPEEVEEILKTRYRLTREEMYKSELISPTAAEKLLAKVSPKRWEDLQHYVVRKPGAMTLARDTDSRPVAGGAVADYFK